jgi:gliding motility-associated-like protein
MRSNFPFASVIEEPNEKGTQARYMFSGFNMKREYVHMSMNYIRSFSYSAKENGIQAKKANCADLPVDFSLLYERADSVKWDFGDAASGAANYSTALNAQHRFTTPGDYTVKAVIYHRCFVDTAVTKINIRTDEAVKLPTVLHDTTLCFGNNLIFDATAPYAKNYTWFVDNYLTYEPRRQVKTEGVYDVIIRNDCSIDRKVFNVKFTNCDCKVFVPGAFTPNNDGLNDVFKPSTQCFVQQYRFTVFNRFGQVVFTTTDPSKGWNGFSGPYAQGTGTFIWTVQYFDPSARKMMSDKGSVLLIK